MWDAITEMFRFLRRALQFLGRRNRAVEAVASAKQVYEQLHRCLRETSASRAIILRTENGGGVLRVDKPMYGSILYEVGAGPGRREDWQKARLDERYIVMLDRLQRSDQGHIHIRLSDPDCAEISQTLRDIYESENVQLAHVFLLSHDVDHIVYAVIHYQSDRRLLPGEGVHLQAAINRLRNLFSGVHELTAIQC